MKGVSIKIKNLIKVFPDNKCLIIDGFNLNVCANERLGIIGPSGVGKTTLVNIVSGIDKNIQSGDLIFYPNEFLTRLVFQDKRIFPWLNVEKNIMLGCSGSDINRDRLFELARSLQILSKFKSYPKNLSGGEMSCVALARALIKPSHLLILDEPFNGMDLDRRADAIKVLKEELLSYNATLIMISHDIYDTIDVCDKIVLIKKNEPFSVFKQYYNNILSTREEKEKLHYQIKLDIDDEGRKKKTV